MYVPAHKPANSKFNADEMVRTMIPLTQEDKEQSGNLPLINTLRQASVRNSANVDSQPPSFYDEDQNRWAKKY